ncbi:MULTISPECIES: GGDEF domain-containing protein [Comamonas]|uniref:diguanylate cyclase n=1 Tax=Comamonas testosteroni TaxID=285 RepID=A0A096FJZ6_COMTE|nr:MULTISPECIES: GGDEF domain-containing protein [Comamonas]KGH30686.1 diguanylate cyclase [Comamonas testosteroni]MPT12132.1 GGDEF domain-containing protein [Comamonas sp.]
MPSNLQLYLLVAPVCITALGALMAFCWLGQRRSVFLLSTACGLTLTGLALGWQCLTPHGQLVRWAIYTGPIYLLGAWLCTWGVAQKFSVSSYPKVSALVSIIVVAALYEYSIVQDNIAARVLWLNTGLGIIHFIPFPAIALKRVRRDGLEKLLYRSYGAFAIYTVLRPIMVLFLGFTELQDMLSSIYWLVTMLGSLLFSLAFSGLMLIVSMRDAMATLRDERNHDMLTGVLNRRGFWELADLLARDRKAQPISIVAADLDHFKRVNDSWGHEYGDGVLKAVAEVVQASVRGSDLVARFGGEEFVLLLTHADIETAQRVAQRIRAGAVEIIAPLPDGQRVTLSMGIVVNPFGSDLREAVMRADQQLYKAKELGRDQVVVHGPGDVAAAA